MNADARDRAWEYYQAAGRDMNADLAALAAHPQGIVLLTPWLVVLMKPVCSTAPEQWTELSLVFPAADAWYIHLLVGDLRQARSMAAALPQLHWLCFQRGLRTPVPHRYPWQAFLRH